MELYGENAHSGYASAYRTRRAVTLDLVHRAARPGASVLDLAAAQGNFALMLAEEGYQVTWNDLRAELADYVRSKWESGDLRYLPGNALDLAGLAPFDLVLATEVIEHVAHPDVFLKKIFALVKPRGHLVLTTPNGEYFRNRLPRYSDCPDPSVFEDRQFRPDGDGHLFLLHRDELDRLARAAGFEVLEFQYYSSFLTAGHLKLSHLLKRLPLSLIDRAESLASRFPTFVQRKVHTGCAVLLKKQ